MRRTLTRAMPATLAVVLACGPPVDADLVVRGGTVIDGTGSSPIVADVFVRDGRIVRVAAGTLSASPGAKEIDATGQYLIPGLTDAHVHFGLGAPMPTRADETTEVLSRDLYYGVTSIFQMGGTGAGVDSIRVLRSLQEAQHLVAPTIYASGGHLTIPGSHPIYTIFPPLVRQRVDSMARVVPPTEPLNLDEFGIGVTLVRSPSAIQQAVAARAAGGMDFVKITIESGPTAFGDNHPQMSLETARAIVSEARSHGLRVFAHATSLDELETAYQAGANGVVHAVRNEPLPDSSFAKELADAHFYVVPTLALFTEPKLDDPFLGETVSAAEIRALREPGFQSHFRRFDCCADFEEVLANVAMLYRTGVPIVAGTDTGNPFIFPGYAIHRELELLVRAGLSSSAALAAATRNAAEMVGAAAEFGTLEVGKRADIVVLDGDPLGDIRNTRRIAVVIARGRVVDRAGLIRGDERSN